ncbi:heterokaryon incompatibility protein-domain-containing protein [Rhexocercosporidium sp. MPI-PUGE-AT-0058]|nr:heterokaryon incompatibility protein-domain-containing protein [Rhexocercosporidium sp. MPI-PUGE-AT-0058]
MADNELLTVTATRSKPITVCSGCQEQAYLQLTVPPTFSTVKQITFRTTSHDQGFSHEEDRYGGTYDECFSFFDATIVTPEGHERARWRFQNNRHARSEPFTHVSIWSDQSSEAGTALAISSIQVNDTIRILPKAHYRAWRNYVLSVDIEVVGTKAVDSSTASSLGMPSAVSSHTLYGPLEESQKQIRTLRLLAGPPESPICCDLDVTELSSEDHVRYEALSYCWGNMNSSEFIEISGQQFGVTSNLHAALKRLRYESGKARTLWVDAICINQLDPKERAWQVQMMNYVYAQAQKVIVWLGDRTKFTGGFGYHELRGLFERAQLPGTSYESFLNDEGLSWNQGTTIGPALTTEEIMSEIPHSSSGASTLFDFPWFRRIWVLQEVFNATRVVVVCGEQTASWFSILQVNVSNDRFMMMPGPMNVRVMPALFSDLFAITRSSGEARFGYAPQQPVADILDIVVAGLDLDASDPRDKLFALLNLAQNSNDAALLPDYEKDVSTIFCDFTRCWITSRESLRILSAVHCSVGRTWQRLSPLPAPLQSTPRPSWTLWNDGKSAWGRASLGLSVSTKYRASGDTKPDVILLQQNANPSTLLLRGVQIGTIERINPFPYYNTDATLSNHRKAYEQLFDPINHRGIFTSGAQGSLGSILDLREPPPDLIEDHLYAHYDYASQTGGAVECHPNCFFTISNGKTGLCPSMAREGDLIVVLLGGNVPYVVRSSDRTVLATDGKAGRQVEFIGECYLPDYMAGEGIENRKDDFEIFELV